MRLGDLLPQKPGSKHGVALLDYAFAVALICISAVVGVRVVGTRTNYSFRVGAAGVGGGSYGTTQGKNSPPAAGSTGTRGDKGNQGSSGKWNR